jgi:hypothetical protein
METINAMKARTVSCRIRQNVFISLVEKLRELLDKNGSLLLVSTAKALKV